MVREVKDLFYVPVIIERKTNAMIVKVITYHVHDGNIRQAYNAFGNSKPFYCHHHGSEQFPAAGF